MKKFLLVALLASVVPAGALLAGSCNRCSKSSKSSCKKSSCDRKKCGGCKRCN